MIQNLRILFTAKKVRVRVNSRLDTLQKKKISRSLSMIILFSRLSSRQACPIEVTGRKVIKVSDSKYVDLVHLYEMQHV